MTSLRCAVTKCHTTRTLVTPSPILVLSKKAIKPGPDQTFNVKLRKSGPWEIPECGAELHWGTADRFLRPRKMLQCKVRTWLQLMGCALVLELGVLILERVERCDSVECDRIRCGVWQNKVRSVTECGVWQSAECDKVRSVTKCGVWQSAECDKVRSSRLRRDKVYNCGDRWDTR